MKKKYYFIVAYLDQTLLYMNCDLQTKYITRSGILVIDETIDKK